MSYEELLTRVTVDPQRYGGKPCIRDTRIGTAIILDALAEGLSPEEIIDHYPGLERDDIRAAAAYASELARENLWKVPASCERVRETAETAGSLDERCQRLY